MTEEMAVHFVNKGHQFINELAAPAVTIVSAEIDAKQRILVAVNREFSALDSTEQFNLMVAAIEIRFGVRIQVIN